MGQRPAGRFPVRDHVPSAKRIRESRRGCPDLLVRRQPVACRCMLKPEWAPPLDNVHPQKNQSFVSVGHLYLPGGRQRPFVSSSTPDAYWSAAETPDYGEVIFPD